MWIDEPWGGYCGCLLPTDRYRQTPTEKGAVAVSVALVRYAAVQVPPAQSASLEHARYSLALQVAAHAEPANDLTMR